MVPEAEYIKIDQKYAYFLLSLPKKDRAILFDAILYYYTSGVDNIIKDAKLKAIFELLVCDFD